MDTNWNGGNTKTPMRWFDSHVLNLSNTSQGSFLWRTRIRTDSKPKGTILDTLTVIQHYFDSVSRKFFGLPFEQAQRQNKDSRCFAKREKSLHMPNGFSFFKRENWRTCKLNANTWRTWRVPYPKRGKKRQLRQRYPNLRYLLCMGKNVFEDPTNVHKENCKNTATNVSMKKPSPNSNQMKVSVY